MKKAQVMNSKRMIVGIGAAAAAVTLLVGCTNDESSDNTSNGTPATTSASASGTAEPGGPHNTADVAYVQMMIPHHEQAVEMAELVPSRSSNPDVVALAAQIEQAQAPEIEQMEGWLKAWGEPAMPMTSAHGMPAMPGMEGGSGHGMMTAEQMQALENAKGPDFDRMWLEMMIEHHQGAVAGSEQILTTGQSEQVRQLAQQIVSSQQAEIAQMEALLGR
ncbi:uncharacterized protein (DUF305 family) [Prescottella agglutinans]|uniref:Uncharacterized protein (DUF305 family) n=2 Tax=Prescottella agglutinans TaxID=1644129 RepID=A0ABT6MF83_9NOCA|nr:uncharacterized protein (DUF305 family) [Prescottella agglutinans]